MVFIETHIFTKSLAGLVTDEEYRMLQNDLLNDPEAGSLIRGGGGIRKIRAAAGGEREKWWRPSNLPLQESERSNLHVACLSEIG